jgi:hypothetical protein
MRPAMTGLAKGPGKRKAPARGRGFNSDLFAVG